MLCLQNRLQGIMGVAVPLFHARGVFQYSFGLIPYRRPVHTVGRFLWQTRTWTQLGPVRHNYSRSIIWVICSFSGEAHSGGSESLSQFRGHQWSAPGLLGKPHKALWASQADLWSGWEPAPYLHMSPGSRPTTTADLLLTVMWQSYDGHVIIMWLSGLF